MIFSVDVETACTVPDCPDHGKSMCRNDHSLSPWHSRITVLAAVGEDGSVAVIRSGPASLRQWLEKRDPDYTVCGHNFKFDWLHLARHGFEIPLERWVGDSQLAAYVSTEKIPDHWLQEYAHNAPKGTRKAGKHSLKTLAPYFLGVEPYWEAAAAGDHDNDEYVRRDAEYTLALVRSLEGKLRELDQYDFYKEKLLPWTKLLLQAEWRGVAINTEGLLARELELQTKAIELKEQLDKQWAAAHRAYRSDKATELQDKYTAMAAKAGKPFNYGSRYWFLYENARSKLPRGVDYGSPKQMAWLLRDYQGYSISSLEGDESTGREVLERLADEGKEDVKTYLEWRKVNKLLSAFIPKYKELTVDGAIHPIYNPTNTRTGRTSSERPNMQQVPPALRPLFVARPGYKLIGYDAAAIEAKLIAYYSEDPTLYAIIRDGVSIHDHNTKVFFGLDCTYSEVKKEHADKRAAAKNVGFALFYNAGANRIRIAFAQKGYHLTDEECRRIHKRFKSSYPAAIKCSETVTRMMEQGNVLVNLLGRPLKIEHAEDAYMQAFNTLIQSSASDLNLHAAFLTQELLKKNSIESYPTRFVHDYVEFEVREEQAEAAAAILRSCLTNFSLETAHGQIKLEVEGGIMSRWEK